MFYRTISNTEKKINFVCILSISVDFYLLYIFEDTDAYVLRISLYWEVFQFLDHPFLIILNRRSWLRILRSSNFLIYEGYIIPISSVNLFKKIYYIGSICFKVISVEKIIHRNISSPYQGFTWIWTFCKKIKYIFKYSIYFSPYSWISWDNTCIVHSIGLFLIVDTFKRWYRV